MRSIRVWRMNRRVRAPRARLSVSMAVRFQSWENQRSDSHSQAAPIDTGTPRCRWVSRSRRVKWERPGALLTSASGLPVSSSKDSQDVFPSGQVWRVLGSNASCLLLSWRCRTCPLLSACLWSKHGFLRTSSKRVGSPGAHQPLSRLLPELPELSDLGSAVSDCEISGASAVRLHGAEDALAQISAELQAY